MSRSRSVAATSQPSQIVLVGAIIGLAVTVIIIGGIVYLAFRKYRLNWYQKNLLEMSESYPEIVRCRQRDWSPESSQQSFQTLYRWSSTPNILVKEEMLPQTSKSLEAEPVGKKEPPSRPANPSEFWVPPEYRRQSQIRTTRTGSSASLTDSRTSSSMFKNIVKNQIDRSLYDVRQDSVASDDMIVGQCGSLQMSVSHDSAMDILTVRLIQANDLTAKRTDDQPNPYFKVSLLIDSKTTQSYQSRTYKQTRHPDMDDEFIFDIPRETLAVAKLEALVYDHEQFTLDECIGCCLLSLGRLEIPNDPTEKIIFWAEILPVIGEENENSVGDLLLRISHLPKAQRLTITVFKARNLIVPDDVQEPPDPSVKIALLLGDKRIKKGKKTKTQKATYNPTWNENLSFNVSKISVCDLTLEILLLNEQSLFGSKPIGKLELKLHQCKELWKAFLKGQDSVAKWYQLQKMTAD